MRGTSIIVCIGVALYISGAATAGDIPASASEDAIRYRQSVYIVMDWHWSEMAQMIKGKKPYDREGFVNDALLVDELSKLPIRGFIPGSDKGGNTRARHDIWTDWKDFKARMDSMQGETAKLAAVAKGGDIAAIKRQFSVTAQSCKACHDVYRE